MTFRKPIRMLRLELTGISKQYPAVRANDKVNLQVAPGLVRSTRCWAKTAPARAR